MSDLTARLRNTECAWRADDLHGEAAARIEALEAERAALIEAALDHRATASRALGREQDVRAVIAEAVERLHAASIPLGVSELAFAQATIRDVHAILLASRVPQGAAEPSRFASLGSYDRTPPDLSVASEEYWRGAYDAETHIMAMLGIPINDTEGAVHRG